MKKIKTECHICGDIIKTETAPAVCGRCGANLADRSEEMVQKAEYSIPCATDKKKVGPCQVVLTNRRLIRIGSNPFSIGMFETSRASGSMIGILAGTAIQNSVKSNKYLLSIPLEAIKTIGPGKVGPFVKAVTVYTNDGLAHRFGVSQRNEWVNILGQFAPYKENL